MESRQGLKNALLPESLEAQKLDEMLPGETKATRCWALKITRDRAMWLHPDFDAVDDLDETNPLLVTKTELGGFIVDATLVAGFRWSLDEDLSAYEIPQDKEWLTVVRLIH